MQSPRLIQGMNWAESKPFGEMPNGQMTIPQESEYLNGS
jgi:hypothetical protein